MGAWLGGGGYVGGEGGREGLKWREYGVVNRFGLAVRRVRLVSGRT